MLLKTLLHHYNTISETKLQTNGMTSRTHLILCKNHSIWPSKQKPRSRFADSFKIDLNFPSMDVNEISADETSSDQFELNEVSEVRGGQQ